VIRYDIGFHFGAWRALCAVPQTPEVTHETRHRPIRHRTQPRILRDGAPHVDMWSRRLRKKDFGFGHCDPWV
jgi:hypothetical protein